MNNTEVLFESRQLEFNKLSKPRRAYFQVLLDQLMNEVVHSDFIIRTREMEYCGVFDLTGESISTFKHEVDVDAEDAYRLYSDLIRELDYHQKDYKLPFRILRTYNTETNETISYSVVGDKPVIVRTTAGFDVRANMPKISPEQKYYILRGYNLKAKYDGDMNNCYGVILADQAQLKGEK